MPSPHTLLALAIAATPGASFTSTGQGHVAGLSTDAIKNRASVEHAFRRWAAGSGSFYDLLADDASVTISGHSEHSGTLPKAAFLRERAKPFQARFLTPIVPTGWTIWATGSDVIVRWSSQATACDGMPYVNEYAYFINMNDGRAMALTMFLNMAAFESVWNRCAPVDSSRKDSQ